MAKKRLAEIKRGSLALRKFAELITRELFTAGDKQIADRLVLVDVGGRDLGGLCEEVVVDRICDVMETHSIELAVAMLAKSCQGRM